MSGTALTPGSVLAGRFRLDVLLDGSDGAGLWRATDRVLARNVAVHVLPDTDPRAGALLTAARTSALVSDVRLLRVLDAAAEEGLVYVVNEWGFGASLDQLLADGPIAPRRAAWVVREVAEAIATAHRNGVAHGRLVPENVMVTDAGSVKVIGFVIDEVLNGRADFTHHRVTGGEPMDAFAADVVNLGALLYAALVGKWPGTEGSRLPPAPSDRAHPLRPRQVRAGVPRPLDAICTRVLDADHHPHSVPLDSAHEVYAALSDFIGDGAGAGAPLPGPHAPGRPGPGAHGYDTTGHDTTGHDTTGHDTRGQSATGAGDTATGDGAGQAAGGVESTTVLGRDELPGTTGDTPGGTTGHDTGSAGTDEDADTQETPEQGDVAPEHTQVHEALAPTGADDESQPEPEDDAGRGDAPSRGAGADRDILARNEQESLDPEATQVGAPVFLDDDPPRDASDAATSTGPGSAWSAARDTGPSSPGPSSPGPSSPGDSSPDDSSHEPDGAGSQAPGSSGRAQGREEEHEAWARSWGEDRERARSNPAAAPPPLPDPPVRPLFADDHRAGTRPPATPAHGTSRTDDDRRHPPPDTGPGRGDDPDPTESPRTGWAGSVPSSWGPDETPPPPVGGPGWSDREGAVPGRSWLRLAIGLGVLVLLVVVAVVAVDLTRDRSDVADPGADASGPASPSATAGRPVTIAAVSDFDPEGDPPRENPDRAGLAADGKVGTAWNTSTYFDPLERLKSGVGLLVDLGSPRAVGAVRLRLEGSPTSLTLFAAPEATTAPSDVEGLTSVGTAEGARRSVTLRPDEPITTRWLVVWLTSLPQVSGGYQGRVAEITVRS